MLKYFLFAYILLLSFRLHAETVSGNCTVYNAPFGEALFYVSPGTIVECGPPKKSWCTVMLDVFIEKKYVYDGTRVLANARIRDRKGKLIGRSNMDFSPVETVAENDTAYLVRLGGYIEAICIEDTSIVEHELEKIFRGRDSLPSLKDFEKHFRDFSYEKWISKGPFEAYLLKDVLGEYHKKGIRAVIIFEYGIAVAVVYGRNIGIKRYELHMAAPNYNLYVLKGGNEAYKKKLGDTFMKELDTLY